MTSNQTDRALAGKPKTLQSIQTLRALAATAVLLFHLKLVGLGYAGVDVFFVISGFIMGKVGVKDTPGRFMHKRLARIVPIYWGMTIVVCVMSLIPGAMRHFSFDLASLAKSLLFIPYRNGDGDIFPLIVPGWTLNFEMFFYIVFATLLFSSRPRLYAVLLLCLLAVIGAVQKFSDPVLATYTSPLLLEFAAGLLLSLGNPIRTRVGGLVGLLAGFLGFFAVAFSGELDIEGLQRAVLLGGPALLVVAGAMAIEKVGAWPFLPGAQMLGDASYSLYLTHGLVISATEKIGSKLHLPWSLQAALGLAAAFGLAIFTYRFVEMPILRLLSPGSRTPRRMAGQTSAAPSD